jgi:hypothetical protein
LIDFFSTKILNNIKHLDYKINYNKTLVYFLTKFSIKSLKLTSHMNWIAKILTYGLIRIYIINKNLYFERNKFYDSEQQI